jgi:hypothetical protein
VPHATANLPREPIDRRTIGFADWLRFLCWYAACGLKGSIPGFPSRLGKRKSAEGRGPDRPRFGTPSCHPLFKAIPMPSSDIRRGSRIGIETQLRWRGTYHYFCTPMHPNRLCTNCLRQ